MVATRGNFVDLVNLLLEHRPNLNSIDKDGGTALTIACKEGYTEIATALLNAGAYVNMQVSWCSRNLYLYVCVCVSIYLLCVCDCVYLSIYCVCVCIILFFCVYKTSFDPNIADDDIVFSDL